MQANEQQVGGSHYKSKFQHWDFVHLLELPYLSCQVTRYLSRWRKKNGVEDLEKAIHYMVKLMEQETTRRNDSIRILENFLHMNELQESERFVFNMLVNYKLGDETRLQEAHTELLTLLSVVKNNVAAAATIVPVDPAFRDAGDEWGRKPEPEVV